MRRLRPPTHSHGFTLIEAMVALTITVTAGSAVLLGIGSSLETAEYAFDQTLAQGIAQTLMNEIAGCQYYDAGASPTQWPLGPGAGESSRDQFDDIDDYHGLTQGIVDRWGIPLGSEAGGNAYRPAVTRLPANYFADWQQSVQVYYVSEADPDTRLATGQTSNVRRVEVVVTKQEGANVKELIRLKRVFAYVPTS